MTKAELSKFLKMIKGSYLAFEQTKESIALWASEVGEVSIGVATEALKRYQRGDERNIPPTPGSIRKLIAEIFMPSLAIPFEEAKAKGMYYYHRAVKDEGSVKPYNPNGAPNPTISEMPWVEKRQKAIYDNYMLKCREKPLSKLSGMQKALDIRDRRTAINSKEVYLENKGGSKEVDKSVTETVGKLPGVNI